MWTLIARTRMPSMQAVTHASGKMAAMRSPVQVPNFVLAAPTLVISATAVWKYFMHDPARCITLGNLASPQLLARLQRLLEPISVRHAVETSSRTPSNHTNGYSTGFYADAVFVFVAQLAAMALFAGAFMHIQVRPWPACMRNVQWDCTKICTMLVLLVHP
jgi:hypothetical protein